jgi:hypothetical protein
MTGRRHRGQRMSRHECMKPFVQLPKALIRSVALSALSLAARRTLDRLIDEHLAHGARENGRLEASYRQMAADAGVGGVGIVAALNELESLGLIAVARGEGKRAVGAARMTPNLYRLTFLPDHEDAAPTNDWLRFEPSEGAGETGRRAAMERARKIADLARKRRHGRTEAEAVAASKGARDRLVRLNRDKVDGPGNLHTRAALNEANVAENPRGTSRTRPEVRVVRTPDHIKGTTRTSGRAFPRGTTRTSSTISTEGVPLLGDTHDSDAAPAHAQPNGSAALTPAGPASIQAPPLPPVAAAASLQARLDEARALQRAAIAERRKAERKTP